MGVNANDGVQQRYWTALKRVPDLVQQLARAQGLPRLPDSRGQDALPEAVDDEHPFAWAEAQEMFRQEAEALAAAGGGAVSAIVAGMRNDLPLVDLMRQLEQRRRQEQQAGALQAQRLPPPPQQQAQRSSARCSSPQQSPERKQPPQQQPGLEGMDDESFLEAGGGMASQFPMSPGQEEVETQPPGQEEVEEEAPPEVLPPTVRPPAQPAAPSSPARTTRAAAASAVAAATAPMHTDAQAKVSQHVTQPDRLID